MKRKTKQRKKQKGGSLWSDLTTVNKSALVGGGMIFIGSAVGAGLMGAVGHRANYLNTPPTYYIH